jgi:outer membrane lipoprotein-sorting protein
VIQKIIGGQGMKVTKTLTLLLILLSITSILGTGCRKRVKAPEEILNSLKEIRTYTANVNIILKNDKQVLKYECRQFFDKSLGYRLEVGSDRVQIHKDRKIFVDDKKNGSKYVLEDDFDKIYSLSFIGKYIGFLYTNKDIKYSSKDEEGRSFQIIEVILPGDNRNLYKADLYIDKKSCAPEKIIVYDNKSNEKVLIEYSAFVPNEQVNSELFKVE